MTTTVPSARKEVAIVGLGCRLPGDIEEPDQLWNVLLEGRELLRAPPAERRRDQPYIPEPSRAGWLTSVDGFDAAFFGISPREAQCIDPQHRMMLEVAWEAVERSGQSSAALTGQRLGVYVGIASHDYEDNVTTGPSPSAHGFTGTSAGFAAGRISYVLDVSGPSLSVDTGCSSALLALHYAAEAIATGDCELAIAGGVNLILSPTSTLALGQLGALSPRGRCNALDAGADGFARSEGCIAIVLKELSRAVADGDHIWGLVRGSYVNHDGRSKGLTVPNGEAQRQLLAGALERAGLRAEQVSYLEMHGTGTPVGDPIEFEAIRSVYGQRSNGHRCVLGAVKTNLGHLEACAGLAGVLKVALALDRECIPANLNFERPNPELGLEGLPFHVPREPEAWPREADVPRRAGVSSFGLSGTNVHVILEEAPLRAPQHARSLYKRRALPLSAQSPAILGQTAQRWANFLQSSYDSEFDDICNAAATRRNHLSHRAVALGDNRQQVIGALQRLADSGEHPNLITGRFAVSNEPRLVFVFPGHGSQWIGMGRQLMRDEPVFRAALEECAAEIHAVAGWSVLDELSGANTALAREENDVVQPVLVAMEIALARLWQSWGIQPAAVIGHSMGEVAAAHVAGALSLEDAARVICLRSRVLRRVLGRGSMVLVQLSMAEAGKALQGRERDISIAVNNSPNMTVLSGDTEALRALVGELEARAVFCRWIRVQYASHGPQIDELTDELRQVLSPVAPRAGNIPMYSTLLGKLTDGACCDGEYWTRNLREPVLFATAVEAALADEHGGFVEVSPHPLLVSSIDEVVKGKRRQAFAVGSLRRDNDENAALLEALCTLHAHGVAVDWQRRFEGVASARPLPPQVWQRDRHWVNPGPARAEWHGAGEAGSGHPFLVRPIELAVDSSHRAWDVGISLARFPYLRDHRVAGATILPATAYLELGLAGARLAFGNVPVSALDVRLHEPIVLGEDEQPRVQLIVTEDGASRGFFRVSSRASVGAWTLHARGRLEVHAAEAPAEVDITELRARHPKAVASEAFYRRLGDMGLQYGPAFNTIEELWVGERSALARVSIPSKLVEQEQYQVHPCLLDGCLQVLAELVMQTGISVPTALGRYRLFREPGSGVHVLAEWQDADGKRTGTVRVWDAEGRLVAELDGVELEQLDTAAQADHRRWYHALTWSLEPLVPSAAPAKGAWLVLGDGRGLGNELAALLRARGGDVAVADRAVLGRADVSTAEALLRSAFAKAPARSIVCLWGLDAELKADADVRAVGAANEAASVAVATLIQALESIEFRDPPSISFVTRGAHQLPGDPAPERLGMTSLWGGMRAIAAELPHLRCTAVDLQPSIDPGDAKLLLDELLSSSDDQVVLRGEGRRHVGHVEHVGLQRSQDVPLAYDGSPYRLSCDAPGNLSELKLRVVERQPPAPGQVELAVEVAGLNFIDVMKALNVYPGAPGQAVVLGGECVGTITAVGEGVAALRVGDRVVAVAQGAFASHVVTDARWVFPLPAGLAASEAACVPLVFATAWHALHDLARLQRGESILIHSASGGTGLAAVQIAQRFGAEVFATAGRPEKRALLQELGVRHVMDSRSVEFAEQIRAITAGRGVDVVLNSLSGEAIDASFAALAAEGRFIELGKKDIYADRPIASKWFKKRISLSSVDLAGMMAERPQRFAGLLQAVMAEFVAGRLKPLQTRDYRVDDAVEAFREMAQAKHVGKLAIRLSEPPQRVWCKSARDAALRPEATYVITGAFGALGSGLAEWLVDNGARHLALVGRNADARSEELAAQLTSKGAAVRIFEADVAHPEQVGRLFEELRASDLPVRGVFHAAGVLEDRVLTNLDPEALVRVLRPKVGGAWALHRATEHLQLDHFVLYSSAASLLGSPGQFAYGAANAFLDGLAQFRRARGLPALSIGWGPIADVGLAAENERRVQSISWRGMMSLPLTESLAALGDLLEGAPDQVSVLDWNYRQYFEAMPAMCKRPSLKHILAMSSETKAAGTGKLQISLRALAPDERLARLEAHLREEFAIVLRADVGRIERFTPIASLGLDSLMGLELRNRLELATGVRLPAALLWTYTNIAQLAEYLISRMFEVEAEAGASARGSEAALPAKLELSTDSREAAHPLSELKQELGLLESALDAGG